MSGENPEERNTPPDSTRARTARAESMRAAAAGPPPLPDQNKAGPPPPARAKKDKPPPGMITAGGVDMARGHAGNIHPKGLGPAVTPAVPRVVLSAETDPRRVPTAPRLIVPTTKPAGIGAAASGAAAASPWGTAAVEVVDKRDLPSANLPVTPAPVVVPEKQKSGGWLRLAVVVVLLLLAAGLVRRVLMATMGPESPNDPQRTYAQAPPLPPEATADPTATAAARPRNVANAPSAEADASATPSEDAADASVDLDASADPAVEVALEPTIALGPRRAAPPPPKPTFKPLFELPSEKNK